MAEDYSYDVDVFKEFARTKSEFIRILKKSKHIIGYLRFHGYDVSKIDKAVIEVDKGREGNWNNYVREFEGIKPRKGENWYEYQIYIKTIPKK